MGWHHPTYEAAVRDARERANATGLDVYLRRAGRYEGPGYVVGYLSTRGYNDSEAVTAERIRPDRR